MSGAEAIDPQAEVERLKARMIQRSFFVMFRRIVAPERLKSVMLDHYRWIIDLEKQGVVFASGPMFSADGSPGVGMTVFRVDDIETAAALAASDPFCTSGAAEFEIKRWQVNEGRITVAIDFSDQSYEFR
ncbi:hypothetical protein H7F50_13530 [Novosphingobium flavum]|uniref:YciI family protein n=1 Tax=Novosphingobium aerophilum TaxID=2839843 RepID=UPI00163B1C52|nr:YciI family protein [Novosphingobium aerophilum]MBC2662774.1 hypothetical protein [Novosphingobium aerophilum]